LNVEHGFNWIGAIPGLAKLPNYSITATLVAVLVLAIAWVARRELQTAKDPLVPDGRATPRDLFDIITGFVNGMVEGMIGHHGREFVPLLAAMFTFILFSNLIGLVPGFTPPTDSLSTTFGLGIVSFLAYNYFGIREHGIGYLKHFIGPVVWLAPLMVIVEGLSHVFRPVSLGIRLFGNMFADHLVLGIFTDLTKVVIPVAFYMLGAFVCVVQAFVFTVLSMVYIAGAVAHEH
jgi:F-type H+-transporting ATPase subunit a